MNYQRIYDSIIERAKSENRIKLRKNQRGYVYYENHHILPRCLGGGDNEENLVLLTAKEHYICHKLLTYIYIKSYKIMCAFHRMTFSKFTKHKISSRDYEYAKFLRVTTPISEETRAKMKNHKFSEEHKKKLSESHKGPHPKDRYHADFSGEKNPFYNKTHSDKTKEKMKQKKLGISTSRKGKCLSEKHKNALRKPHKPMSEETKKKISEKMKIIRNHEKQINN